MSRSHSANGACSSHLLNEFNRKLLDLDIARSLRIYSWGAGVGKSVVIIGTRGYPSYYGGFETAVRHLAPYLADHGWDVSVYGRRNSTRLDDPNLDQRIERITSWGIETKSVSTLSYGLSASLDAARRRPDVALVMNVANGYFLPILKARSIPSLVNVDGIEWDRAKWGKTARALFRQGAKMTAMNADELVYDSHEIGRRWKDLFNRKGVFIPYGGDTSAELPLEPGLTSRQYVLVVARFVPENTIPEFLEAAKKIAETRTVVIVGSTGYGGELDNAARELARLNENVRWLGHVNDDARLHALWQHCGAYFHGHSVGGTNPALVQAMALGAPTVARETPYNREVLGSDAIYVQADPDEIALAIGRLIKDEELQDRFRMAGIRRAESTYSWELVCDEYRRQLEQLADR
jgi:glycosyltransferase involved in cell wall biosynthesis